MSYHIYQLVEDPSYLLLKKKQHMLSWASARGHLRRAALGGPDIVCAYTAEVDENSLEASVLVETGMRIRWIRCTLDESVARLKEGLHDDEALDAPAPMDVGMAAVEAHAPEEAPHDDALAPTDVTMTLAEAPAPTDEISLAQGFLRGRFAAAKLAAAPARRGRPKAPIVYAGCKIVLHNSDAKYNHARRGKCIPV
jgi:hypothetical protein